MLVKKTGIKSLIVWQVNKLGNISEDVLQSYMQLTIGHLLEPLDTTIPGQLPFTLLPF